MVPNIISLLHEDTYESFQANAVVLDEGNGFGVRYWISKETCKRFCSGTIGCNSFVHCDMGQKDKSGIQVSVGDCWLKDKILKGTEATRDTSNGNQCTSSYKKFGNLMIF